MNVESNQKTCRNRQLRRTGAVLAAALMLAAAPALGQGWWPWSDPEPERPPVPREPVYRPPDQQGPPPGQQAPPIGNWTTKNPICLQLEQRLVQESQRGNQWREALPRLEADIAQADRTYRFARQQLDRRDCYDYFLFSKTLRRTRQCVDLANQAEGAKRRLADLEVQRQQLVSSAGRSYQDDIIRELARNNCGAGYAQEARRRDNANPFSGIWQDEESGGGGGWGGWGGYGAQSFATYRTLCVRLCDGYYFPVSFSTLPNHFPQDETVCRSKCAAPAELYYYQNPGGAVEQAVSMKTQEPYTQLKSAFRYRKEYVSGCSCKQAEYNPQSTAPAGDRAEAWPAPEVNPR